MFNKNKIKDIFNRLLNHIRSFNVKEFFKDKRRVKKLVIILVAVFLVLHVRGCMLKHKKKAIPPRPVQTAIAVKKDVPVYIDNFGTLDTDNSAEIRTQVTGVIKEIHFKEGDYVKKGDLLFLIDPDPYEATLDKAKAALAEDKVDLKLKSDTLQRNKSLFEKKLISQQDYEQYQTDVAAAEAQVKLDKANVKSAQINLAYCYISAPLNGITGQKSGNIGDLVIADSSPVLVSVKDIDILDVDFNVPERDLPKIRGASIENKLKIEVTVEGDEEGAKYPGELSFLDNTVDQTTGTVFMEGVLKNDGRKLWSGQFVQVRLFIGEEKDATVVPYESVQLGKQGSYLFVVTDKNKADLRTVEVGPRDGDDLVIGKGVTVGEKVVTVGQMGLSPGVPVVDVSKKEEKKKGSYKKVLNCLEKWFDKGKKKIKQWLSQKSS